MAPTDEESLKLERVERLEDAREDWVRLNADVGHPFATWEWNDVWWRHFGGERELYTFLCRDSSGRVVAILPLYVAALKPVRTARFLGYADQHSPVCGPEQRPAVARALREVTRDRDGCRLLIAEHLPCEEGWAKLLGGRTFFRSNDPVLRFEGRSWEEYLASRSKNFRRQVKNLENRARKADIELRRADDPQRLESDIEELFRLHSIRWGEETTGVFEGDRAAFHRDVAAETLRQGWLRLWLAEKDGEAVAAWYGWHFAGQYWFLQGGRDPGFQRERLGFLLTVNAVREACREGATAYHFLAGDEEYKWRFATEDPGAESRAIGSGALGRAASLALGVTGSLPAPLRDRVLRLAK